MAEVPPHLKALAQADPGFAQKVMDVIAAVDGAGALDAKIKTLMAMLADAILAHPEGVASLANRARREGATEQEIAETVRVAFSAGGLPALVTAQRAFK